MDLSVLELAKVSLPVVFGILVYLVAGFYVMCWLEDRACQADSPHLIDVLHSWAKYALWFGELAFDELGTIQDYRDVMVGILAFATWPWALALLLFYSIPRRISTLHII